MALFDKIFGKAGSADSPRGGQVSPEIRKDCASLQILFPESMNLNAATMQTILRSYGQEASAATIQIDASGAKQGTPFGRAQWGKHVVEIVGFSAPMPAAVVEKVVAPAHYQQPLKARAREHKSHLLLLYAGTEPSSLEQHVALAAVAGTLASQALVVANESAVTSVPARLLDPREMNGSRFEFLRNLPLLLLYMGFVKYNLEGGPVWMRTYGGRLFRLPDLAKATAGHHEGERTMGIFEKILGYLLNSGARLEPGHTLQISTEVYLRFRSPLAAETFLQGGNQVLVVEEISPDEINRPE